MVNCWNLSSKKYWVRLNAHRYFVSSLATTLKAFDVENKDGEKILGTGHEIGESLPFAKINGKNRFKRIDPISSENG